MALYFLKKKMYDGFKKGDVTMRKAPIIITFCVLMAGITACGSRTQTTQNQSNKSRVQREDKDQKVDTEESINRIRVSKGH